MTLKLMDTLFSESEDSSKIDYLLRLYERIVDKMDKIPHPSVVSITCQGLVDKILKEIDQLLI